MLIIPAIDLKNGQCVRLRQGRMEDDTVFSDNPVAVARQWVEQGARRLHLVDLDGAFAGEPRNAAVAEPFAMPIQTYQCNLVVAFVLLKMLNTTLMLASVISSLARWR